MFNVCYITIVEDERSATSLSGRTSTLPNTRSRLQSTQTLRTREITVGLSANQGRVARLCECHSRDEHHETD